MTLDELYDRLAALRAEGYGRSKVMVEADQANGAPFLRREIADVGAIRGELVLLCADPEPVENATPKPVEDTSLQDCRQEYVRLREKAMGAGVRSRKGFETLCRRYLRAPATPEAWVAAAREVAHDFCRSKALRIKSEWEAEIKWNRLFNDDPPGMEEP